MNLFISFVYLILSFSLTVLCDKKYGKQGLIIWMCVSVILCNIQTIKIAEVFGWVISLGNISYGGIFLATDILSEKYGEKSAKEAIHLSFLAMLVFTFFMWLFLQYEPSTIDTSQEALLQIFNYIPRITLGSMTAYYVSQNLDTKLYRLLKDKFKKIWISNNGSTFLSQIVDTVLFVTISFYGVMNGNELLELGLTIILFKIIIAILDTPFIYLATMKKRLYKSDK